MELTNLHSFLLEEYLQFVGSHLTSVYHLFEASTCIFLYVLDHDNFYLLTVLVSNVSLPFSGFVHPSKTKQCMEFFI